ncbi:subtilase-type protease inhibitor [Streptomyces gobiensis]|uniref:subtilase-type protease inhibitor n=1 Tax=Streptomyces gobiensis TaxID=2875706 RepID=UPI001E637450|nr:subtilase-type protease inhibitor [Streptomyces gobiensis]UGY92453.1 subtilase-type protease inhibitor [Streptomyces gobiensis]
MRNTARLAAAGTLLTAAVFGPLGGSALATSTQSPSSLYAPSALTLTFAHGESAAASTPERAVTLSCTPKPTGSHPKPKEACEQLQAANGNFNALPGSGQGYCTMEYNPVVVTAQGVWEGKRVNYERTFGNDCVKKAEGMAVFDF